MLIFDSEALQIIHDNKDWDHRIRFMKSITKLKTGKGEIFHHHCSILVISNREAASCVTYTTAIPANMVVLRGGSSKRHGGLVLYFVILLAVLVDLCFSTISEIFFFPTNLRFLQCSLRIHLLAIVSHIFMSNDLISV